ncbi:hypothetical protein J6590_090708 [Homalodisca vitripennis]|nr:hypothetical protein J6590_090708 [Homalodisca vitripennis]
MYDSKSGDNLHRDLLENQKQEDCPTVNEEEPIPVTTHPTSKNNNTSNEIRVYFDGRNWQEVAEVLGLTAQIASLNGRKSSRELCRD